MSITIIHHNDMDGRCAAAIAYRELKDRHDTEINCFETNYEETFPNIPSDTEEIYILDFSFRPPEFDKLIKMVGRENVTWIDHHISVIRSLTAYSDLKGKRTEDWSGTMLTWMHFHPNTDVIPYVVKLIDDYDRWAMVYEDDTLHFYEYTQTRNLKDIKSDEWTDLLNKTQCELAPFIERGRKIKELRYNELKRIINRMGIPMKVIWEGKEYSCMKMNSTYLFSISQIGHIIYDEMGFDIAWLTYIKANEDGDLIRMNNLRSVKVDVSKIAVKHGGGGHPNASGWIENLGKHVYNSTVII